MTCLAKPVVAVAARDQLVGSGERGLRNRRDVPGPLEQILGTDLPPAQVIEPGLIDDHDYPLDLADIMHKVPHTERVEHALAVGCGINPDTLAILQIDRGHDPVLGPQQDAVGGAEHTGHTDQRAELDSLFDEHHRILADLIDQGLDVRAVGCDRAEHLRVEAVLGIVDLDPQEPLTQCHLTQFVADGALGRERRGLFCETLGQPDRAWTIDPDLGPGGRQFGV